MRPRHFRTLLFLFIAVAVFFAASAAAADPLWTAEAPSGIDLSNLAVADDGSVVVAGGDQLIALSPDGEKIWAGWSGTSLDISGDGSYIVTSQGQTVRLFSRDGRLLWSQSLGNGVSSVSISPDAILIAAGGGDAIGTWFNSGARAGINSTGTVQGVRVSPLRDQILFATATALRAYNTSLVPLWYDDSFSPEDVAISADGMAVAARAGNHIRMYHGSGTKLWDRQVPGGNIVSFALSRDGSTVIAGRDDGTVVALDRDGNLLFTAQAGFLAGGVALSNNGSALAAGTLDGRLFIWNRSGTELGTFRAGGPIRNGCVAMSGNGSLIAATDGSAVYGFALSQFAPVAVPAAGEPAGNVTATTVPPVSPESTAEGTVPATSAPAAPEPSALPATTPVAGTGMPVAVAVMACALVVVWRLRV